MFVDANALSVSLSKIPSMVKCLGSLHIIDGLRCKNVIFLNIQYYSDDHRLLKNIEM